MRKSSLISLCCTVQSRGYESKPACFHAEYNSNRTICIRLKYKTSMYFISKGKICLSSILFAKNFLKEMALSSFHQQLSSQPTGSAGG